MAGTANRCSRHLDELSHEANLRRIEGHHQVIDTETPGGGTPIRSGESRPPDRDGPLSEATSRPIVEAQRTWWTSSSGLFAVSGAIVGLPMNCCSTSASASRPILIATRTALAPAG